MPGLIKRGSKFKFYGLSCKGGPLLLNFDPSLVKKGIYFIMDQKKCPKYCSLGNFIARLFGLFCLFIYQYIA